MKVLITGSSGQIGSYAVDAARAAGFGVVGLDVRPSRWTDRGGDIRSRRVCAEAMRGVDAVVHCAAQVSVQASIAAPALDATHNVLGTLRLLEAARSAGVARFVHVSSAAVYGAPVTVPIQESHRTSPASPYGISKLAGERYALAYVRLHAFPVVAVRPFNVYSPRQDPTNPYTGVMSRMATRVLAGEPPLVYGDGLQTRDFVHARDVATALLALARPTSRVPPGTVLNLGSGRETSILDLATRFVSAAGLQAEPLHADALPGEIRRSAADVTLARTYGLCASVPLEEGVRELLATVNDPRDRAAPEAAPPASARAA